LNGWLQIETVQVIILKIKFGPDEKEEFRKKIFKEIDFSIKNKSSKLFVFMSQLFIYFEVDGSFLLK